MLHIGEAVWDQSRPPILGEVGTWLITACCDTSSSAVTLAEIWLRQSLAGEAQRLSVLAVPIQVVRRRKEEVRERCHDLCHARMLEPDVGLHELATLQAP